MIANARMFCDSNVLVDIATIAPSAKAFTIDLVSALQSACVSSNLGNNSFTLITSTKGDADLIASWTNQPVFYYTTTEPSLFLQCGETAGLCSTSGSIAIAQYRGLVTAPNLDTLKRLGSYSPPLSLTAVIVGDINTDPCSGWSLGFANFMTGLNPMVLSDNDITFTTPTWCTGTLGEPVDSRLAELDIPEQRMFLSILQAIDPTVFDVMNPTKICNDTVQIHVIKCINSEQLSVLLLNILSYIWG
jgi:hypothetical protein